MAMLPPGLPDGIFSYQNPYLGKYLEDLSIKDARIFYGHLVYFTAILYILQPFGIFCGT
jgi:hypothetical protein